MRSHPGHKGKDHNINELLNLSKKKGAEKYAA
jgi:hypothetical protein